jgi:hypothetical protein
LSDKEPDSSMVPLKKDPEKPVKLLTIMQVENPNDKRARDSIKERQNAILTHKRKAAECRAPRHPPLCLPPLHPSHCSLGVRVGKI